MIFFIAAVASVEEILILEDALVTGYRGLISEFQRSNKAKAKWRGRTEKGKKIDSSRKKKGHYGYFQWVNYSISSIMWRALALCTREGTF